MVQKLGSQLVELEICETSVIWSVLFQLQALRHLRLSVVSQDGSPLVEPPADRKLAQLSSLWLTSISPILTGTSLPQLKVLRLESFSAPGGISFDLGFLTVLEQLTLKTCKQIKVSTIRTAPVHDNHTKNDWGTASLNIQGVLG